MHRITIILGAAALLITAVPLHAQSGASLGLGGAYTSLARGTEAIFWNPANLGYTQPGKPHLNFKLYSFSIGGGNNAFSIKMIDKYDGKFLDETAKQEILNEISDSDGVKPSAKVDVSVFAVTYKNFGFAFEANGEGDIEIPKSAFELALYGFDENILDFATEGGGVGVGRGTIAYGRTIASHKYLVLPGNHEIRFKEITAGASLSYIWGGGIAEVVDGRTKAGLNGPSTAGTDGIILNSRNVFRHSEGGQGIGLDLGFGFITETNWMFGLAFDNVYGRVSWDKNAEETVVSINLPEGTFIGQFDNELDIDDYTSDETRSISSFSKNLPVNLRMSLAKELMNGKVIPNVEVGRENTRFRITAGGKCVLNFLHLLAGVGYKTEDMFFSGGFALAFRHFYFDLGARSRSAIAGTGSKEFALASSIRFGF